MPSDTTGSTENGVSTTNFYNAVTSYIFTYSPINLTIATNINFNVNNVDTLKGKTWGPSLNVGKYFLKKTLRTSLVLNYNTSSSGGKKITDVFNVKTSLGYAIKKKHNISLSTQYQLRKNLAYNSVPKKSNWILAFTYSYKFMLIDNSSKKK